MTGHLDRLLRDTVTDLAAESEPRDLMPEVLARARRIRRRQWSGSVAAVVTAALLLAVPYLTVRHHRDAPTVTVSPSSSPAPLPSPSPSVAPAPANLDQPVALPYGWVVTAASQTNSTQGGSSYVLDRTTRRYVRVDYPIAVPAPTGTLVAVASATDDAIGLLDRRTGRVAWPLGAGPSSPEWSPDGGRLLVTLDYRGFAVVDAATGAVHTHLVGDAHPCNDDCAFTWYPDGKRVVRAETDKSVPHNEALPDVQLGLRLFDATTGAPGDLITARGIVARVGNWSPDRGTVLVTATVVDGANRHLRYQLVESATGRVLTDFAGPPQTTWWVDGQHLLTQTDRLKLCGVRTTGQAESCATLPTAFFQLNVEVGPG
jgi:dipeptidyl aminopeptidase/acylaminoacyl peptidase